MKRVLTIQDFSCVGRCSLTVAVPIISAAGVECCGIPTALLSNHTGFPTYFSQDLSDCLLPIGDKLAELGITFDAIYTGYIASAEQLSLIERIIDRFRGENTLALVDPVMGDGGRMYSALGGDFPERMYELCKKADIITPNLTEACLLSGGEYNEDMQDYTELLDTLYKRFGARVMLTGVPSPKDNSQLGAVSFDGSEYSSVYTPREDLVCAGTGDILSSALLGAVMRGRSFDEGMSIAVRFTYECVRLTAADPLCRSYGVNFEQALPLYIKLLDR